MRGYHYYLDKPVRVDNVFGATRFERLLWHHSIDEVEISYVQMESLISLSTGDFSSRNNADYLGSNASTVIQERFAQMIQNNVLRPTRQWGPVWIYELEESSSEE